VQLAAATPVVGKDGGRRSRIHRPARLVLEEFARGEGPVLLPPEPVNLARPGAGNQVSQAVAFEVHQLWSEADASANRDSAGLAAGREPSEVLESGRAGAARAGIDAQSAVVELANEQVGDTVAVEVADKGGCVPRALDVERLPADADVNRHV